MQNHIDFSPNQDKAAQDLRGIIAALLDTSEEFRSDPQYGSHEADLLDAISMQLQGIVDRTARKPHEQTTGADVLDTIRQIGNVPRLIASVTTAADITADHRVPDNLRSSMRLLNHLADLIDQWQRHSESPEIDRLIPEWRELHEAVLRLRGMAEKSHDPHMAGLAAQCASCMTDMAHQFGRRRKDLSRNGWLSWPVGWDPSSPEDLIYELVKFHGLACEWIEKARLELKTLAELCKDLPESARKEIEALADYDFSHRMRMLQDGKA